jgi:hypothetical protein
LGFSVAVLAVAIWVKERSINLLSVFEEQGAYAGSMSTSCTRRGIAVSENRRWSDEPHGDKR